MPPKRKSCAWKFFDKIDDKSAKCKLCYNCIKSAGNTTNLIGHLRNVHKASYNEMIANNENLNPGHKKLQFSASSKNNQTEHDDDECVIVPNVESGVVPNVDSVVAAEPPRKKRNSIMSSFENINAFTSSGSKARKINNLILYFICKDNQPLSVVEDKGFQTLMKELAPLYKIPSRQTFTRWLDLKYESLAQIIKSRLQTKEHITLTTDVWSDTQQMLSYLGVTAHFGDDINLCSVTLGVYELDQRHTSEYLCQKLFDTCEGWNIPTTRISAVVTDNAANIVKAVSLGFGTKCHIPCFAHTLNLVAKSAIRSSQLENLIAKVKSVVTWFKQSCIASDELRKVCGERKLIQEVATRWNSTFYMLERFIELSAYELSILQEVISLLRPLEAATKEISGDKYTTSSKIIPLVHCLISKIGSVSVQNVLAKELKTNLISDITKRMSAVESVTSLAIATLLDPRFKKIHFSDPLACSHAVQKIRELLLKSNTDDSEGAEADSDTSADKSFGSFNLWTDHHKLVHNNWKINRGNLNELSDELSLYLRTPVGRLNENPLEIWKDLQAQFPKLYKIAYKFLTIVGSSVPSERPFSKAGLTINQQRNRLRPKRLNKILFLQGVEKKYWDL